MSNIAYGSQLLLKENDREEGERRGRKKSSIKR